MQDSVDTVDKNKQCDRAESRFKVQSHEQIWQDKSGVVNWAALELWYVRKNMGDVIQDSKKNSVQ